MYLLLPLPPLLPRFLLVTLQLPLDDLVLSHMTQLDLFVENMRQQLAQQAAAARSGKAEAAVAAAAAAAAAASGHTYRKASAHRQAGASYHQTPRSHQFQRQQQAGAAEAGGGKQVRSRGTHTHTGLSSRSKIWAVNLQNCLWVCEVARLRPQRIHPTPPPVANSAASPPPAYYYMQVVGVGAGAAEPGGGATQQRWGAARGFVMLNIQNWQQQRVRSARMRVEAPIRAPTWEDVILLVGYSYYEYVDSKLSHDSGCCCGVYLAACMSCCCTRRQACDTLPVFATMLCFALTPMP